MLEQELNTLIDAKLEPILSALSSLEEKIDNIQLTPGKDGKDGRDGIDGKNGVAKDGKNGRDGQDAVVDLNFIIREVIALIPTPKDGKNVDEEKLLSTLTERLPKLDMTLLEDRIKKLEARPIAKVGGSSGPSFLGALNKVPPETPQETVDGIRTQFTLWKTPAFIVADGGVLFLGQGYTVSGKTYTLTVAPENYVKGIR